MDKHEMALKTYDALQKRKKQKEAKLKTDIAATGWNGYSKYITKKQRRYYSKPNTFHE